MKVDLEIVTPPGANAALDVLSVADLKKHIRVTSSSVDPVVEDAIRDAVDYLHGRTGILNRTVLPMTWKLYLPSFPTCARIELPYPPLTAVSSVSYEDSAGDTQTFSSASYIVRTGTLVGEIERLGSVEWPTTERDNPRAVAITFTAGWASANIPRALKRLVKLIAAHWYENREATFADPKALMLSRATQIAFDHLVTALAVPLPYGESE